MTTVVDNAIAISMIFVMHMSARAFCIAYAI